MYYRSIIRNTESPRSSFAESHVQFSETSPVLHTCQTRIHEFKTLLTTERHRITARDLLNSIANRPLTFIPGITFSNIQFTKQILLRDEAHANKIKAIELDEGLYRKLLNWKLFPRIPSKSKDYILAHQSVDELLDLLINRDLVCFDVEGNQGRWSSLQASSLVPLSTSIYSVSITHHGRTVLKECY